MVLVVAYHYHTYRDWIKKSQLNPKEFVYLDHPEKLRGIPHDTLVILLPSYTHIPLRFREELEARFTNIARISELTFR